MKNKYIVLATITSAIFVLLTGYLIFIGFNTSNYFLVVLGVILAIYGVVRMMIYLKEMIKGND